MEFSNILSSYGIGEEECRVQLLSGGLINATWKISSPAKMLILQRINHGVFKDPQLIADNLEMLSNHLAQFPDYLFVGPLKNSAGQTLTVDAEGQYYRAFPFIHGSLTIDSVSTPNQAFEAAAQFGKFTNMLRGFDANLLKITLPDFHNLTLRYSNFLDAVEKGNPNRIKQSRALIGNLKRHATIVEEFERIKHNPEFKTRVTHHDTKISNVLFDSSGKGLCVIDLDTVMPGYFISDVGDMMRTYLSPTTEEESDFSKISVRQEIYDAIVTGYLTHMAGSLTHTEKSSFLYAGKFMIYMQALRFLTDHLNNDIYYGAKYPDHNFNRAGNQLVLLEQLIQSIPKS